MLCINELNVSYGDARALVDVTMQIRQGEIISLVGSNGAGKTTLLKTISRLTSQISGTIQFLSQTIDKDLPHQAVERGIVQIPEGRKIFPNLSVRENLEVCSIFPKAKKRRKENLQFVFDLFPILVERGQQLAGSLSGGEQQMLAIGQGLMSCPQLLLIDEPSLGVAPIIVEQIFKTIQEINRQGLTVLLVEQNIELSLDICHRGYVLETGRIILEGSGTDLMSNPLVKEAYLGL